MKKLTKKEIKEIYQILESIGALPIESISAVRDANDNPYAIVTTKSDELFDYQLKEKKISFRLKNEEIDIDLADKQLKDYFLKEEEK